MAFLNLGSDHTLSNLSGASELNHLLNSPFFTDGTELRLTVPLGNYKNLLYKRVAVSLTTTHYIN